MIVAATRLGPLRWLACDPTGRSITITYGEHDDFWQVVIDDDPEEHLDPDLCAALADVAGDDADAPWVVALAEEVEHDLAAQWQAEHGDG